MDSCLSWLPVAVSVIPLTSFPGNPADKNNINAYRLIMRGGFCERLCLRRLYSYRFTVLINYPPMGCTAKSEERRRYAPSLV